MKKPQRQARGICEPLEGRLLLTTTVDYTAATSTGLPGTPVEYQWSLPANGGSVQDFSAAQQSLLDTAGSSGAALYLQLSGINGDSTDPAHQNWIKLVRFDWVGDQNDPDGTPRFGELHVSAGISSASPVLLNRLVQGTAISTGTLAARAAGASFDFLTITFTNTVRISSYKLTSAGGQGLRDEFTLNFPSATVQYTPTTAGQAGTPIFFPLTATTREWTPKQDALIDDPAYQTFPQNVFAKVQNINGESADAKHVNWIVTRGLEWGADLPDAASAAPGASRFFELHLLTTLDKSAPLLMDALATGTVIPDADVAVNIPGQSFDYFALDLDNARVSSYQVTTARNGTTLQEFTLSFTAFTYVVTPINPTTGAPGAPIGFNWDLAASAAPAPLEQAPAPVSLLRSTYVPLGTMTAFLRLDTIAGESADVKHPGWIEIRAFQWAQDAMGAAANQPVYFDIHVISHISKASPALMNALISGSVIPTGDIALRRSPSDSFDYYKIALAGIGVTSYQISGDSEEVTLSVDGATVRYTPLNDNGAPGSPVQYGWVLSSGGGSNQAFLAAQQSQLDPAYHGGSTSGLSFYLRLDGVAGDSTDAQHAGWIAIDNFDWVGNPNDALGLPGFGEIHVIAPLSIASPLLLDRLAKGTAIAGGNLAIHSGTQSVDFFSVNFAGAVRISSYKLLASVSAGASAQQEFTLAFSSASVQYILAHAGAPNETVSASLVGATREIAPAQDSLIAAKRLQSFNDIFVRLDTIDGESADTKHLNWIVGGAIEWGADLPGGPAPNLATDPARFFEVRVVARMDKSAPLLMQALSRGTVLASADLALRQAGKSFDYLRIALSNVQVSSYQLSTAASGEAMQEFTLAFTAFTETFTPINNATGSPGAPVMISQDLAVNGGLAPLERPLGQRSILRAAYVPVLAPLKIFLKLDGINGESAEPDHHNWLVLDGIEWGQDQIGGAANNPRFAELHVVARMSIASLKLMHAMRNGTIIASGNLALRKSAASFDYYTVAMSNIRISSYQVVSDAGGAPLEEFTLAFDADTVPPAVVSNAFKIEPRQQVVTTFSEDVSETLGITDFAVENLATHVIVPASSIALAYDPLTNKATWSFPGYPGGLPDGNYRATILSAGVFDHWGNRLSADVTVDFFVLAGDIDHNGRVEFADLVVVAQNYGIIGGRTPATGDANYDGNCDFADLVIVAQQYGVSIPQAGGAVGALEAVAPVKRAAAGVFNGAKKIRPTPRTPILRSHETFARAARTN